jgi:hypothetical protein
MNATVLNKFDQPASGTNDNKLVIGGSVETGAGQDLKKVYVTVDMVDISSAGISYIPSPVAGTITKIQTIIDGAIITADALITGKIGAVAITDGVVTIAFSGSAAGDVDSASPSAANTVAVGDNINFTTNAASGNTVKATILVEITLS